MSGDRFVSELWKQDLLLYMTDHQAEMEFEDGVDNVKISGLKFFTAKDGQNTIPELMAMSGVTYQKPNEQIDLLMVADPSTDVIIEEDE
jgi:type III restriction enzyme